MKILKTGLYTYMNTCKLAKLFQAENLMVPLSLNELQKKWTF